MTAEFASIPAPQAMPPAGAPHFGAPPLGVLESTGLIRLAAMQPELEYLFRHVLVQDAAYDTLLKQERRRLHVAVAETLESLYPDRRDELAAMLAWHYESAGESDRALPMLIAAGGFALRRNANTEAYGFFRRAFGILPADSGDDVVERHRVEIALGMARAGWVYRPASEILVDLVAMDPVAEHLGDPVLSGQLHLWTAIMLNQTGDRYEPGTRFYAEVQAALDTASATGDGQLRGMALIAIGRSVFQNNPRLSAESLEEAVELTQAKDPIGSSLAADTLAQTYAILGDFDKADIAIKHAEDLALRSGDPKAVIDAQLFKSQILAERGDYEASVALARDGATRAAAIGASMCVVAGNMFAGLNELARGRNSDAAQSLQISYDMATEIQAGWWQNLSYAGLSSARCGLGDMEAARAGWDRTLAQAEQEDDLGSEALIRFQRAGAYADGPNPDWQAVADDLQRAIAIQQQIGARPREARARVAYARALEALQRPDEARREHDRAEALFRDIGLLMPSSTPAGSPG